MSTPEIPSRELLQSVSPGSIQAKTWPVEKRLAPMFIENRTIRATLCDSLYAPIAVFTLCWQIALGGQLGPPFATALFALSLPMQGLWWLGNRSSSRHPPSILHWFYEVAKTGGGRPGACRLVEGKPALPGAGDTLKRAFKQLDKTFLSMTCD
ncbi:terminus macrodomain insulation protein YfbV [Shigella flexneri]